MVNNFKILLAAMLLHQSLIFSYYSFSLLGIHFEYGSPPARGLDLVKLKEINKFQKFKNQLIDDCCYVFKIEKFMTSEKYYSIISPILDEAKKKFTSLDIFLKSTNQDLREDYYKSLIKLIACHFDLLLDNKNNIKQDNFNKAKNNMSQAIKNINVSAQNKIDVRSEMKVLLEIIYKANKELYKNISIFTRISSLFI
jgi:hypothetical protein